MAKKLGSIIGSWAFLVGIVLAILAGVLSGLKVVELTDSGVMIALVVIGLIVGLFNITGKETTPFLLSGTCLIIVSFFGINVLAVIPLLSSILIALLAIFVPTTIIVAIKNVFGLAKN